MPIWLVTITRTEWNTTSYEIEADDALSAEDLLWKGLDDGVIAERDPDDGETLEISTEVTRLDDADTEE